MSSKSNKSSRSAKVKHKVERKIEDLKEQAEDLYTKAKDEAKDFVSKKIGLGEQIWLSETRKQQKALFKKLHQDTAKSLSIAKWNENTQVSVDSYTSRVAQEVETQSQAYISKISAAPSLGLVGGIRNILSREQGLVLLRGSDGKRIHFLSQPFFSQSITEDGKEANTISWSQFKEQVFYPYIKGIEMTSRAVADELSLAKKLRQAHVDLSKEQGTDEIKMIDLRKRLESYHFEVSASFWSQPFWNKDFELDAVSLDKFLSLAGGKRSIEELEKILGELKEDNRSQVASSELSLSAPLENDQNVSFHEEQDQKVPTITSSLAPPSSSSGSGSSVSDLNTMDEIDLLDDNDPIVRRFVTETLYYLKGFPKRVAVTVPTYTDIVQSGLRKLAKQVKAGAIAAKTELDISKFLFLNTPLILDNELQQVAQDAKLAQAKKGEEVSAEINAGLAKAKAERDSIVDQVSALYRSKIVDVVASSVESAPEPSSFAVPLPVSASGFALEQQAIPVAQLKQSASKTPVVANFASTLHEPMSQPTGQQAFTFALIALREWQTFNSIRMLERLSVDFLAKLLDDYQPDASLRSIADGLELTKSVGLVTQSVFQKYSQDPDAKTAKAQSKLKAKSKYFAVDGYYRLNTVGDLRAAVVKNGPALVTLPILDSNNVEFWKSADKSAKPAGWHTLLLTEFNDLTNTVTVRHSLGKAWGAFGQATLSFDELFALVKAGIANVITVEDNSLNL